MTQQTTKDYLDNYNSELHSSITQSLFRIVTILQGFEPLKLGYYIYNKKANYDGGKCSCCGRSNIIRTPYCEWCGAKMANADYNENYTKCVKSFISI